MTNYKVIRDSREKTGWTFPAGEQCQGTLTRALKTGDYSLEGYEHLFAIERKGSAAEFVQNITHKDRWELFKAELERLDRLPAAFVICEFTFDDVMIYPNGSGLPRSVQQHVRISPQFYLKRILEIDLRFRTKIHLIGGHFAKEIVSSLFKRIVERWPDPADAAENMPS